MEDVPRTDPARDRPSRESRPVRRRGVERSVEVQLGPLGGFDLRPTRLFVWGGAERAARERIVSLGSAPRNLLIPRREREIQAGSVHVRSLGNPVMTVALAGVHAARKLARERRRH
ncbi:MAG: hypothetical protein M3327_04745 [Actinomycetota bacterium]|nr:hypothetical protein [Actinomycetota bacterium]